MTRPSASTLASLYGSHKTLERTARVLNVSWRTVWRWMKAEGIERGPRGRKRDPKREKAKDMARVRHDRRVRNRAILEARAAGKPIKWIAAHHSVSNATVSRVIKEAKAA